MGLIGRERSFICNIRHNDEIRMRPRNVIQFQVPMNREPFGMWVVLENPKAGLYLIQIGRIFCGKEGYVPDHCRPLRLAFSAMPDWAVRCASSSSISASVTPWAAHMTSR